MNPPLRLRDFVEDADGWLYAVAAYDNTERAGCVLRYVPDPAGDRVRRATGVTYRKLDFAEAYARVAAEKPQYLDLLHRIPLDEIAAVHKPEAVFPAVLARDERVRRLADALGLAPGTAGCTGSLLVGLEGPGSDIDLVVYGAAFDRARARLPQAIREGLVDDLSEDLWRRVYAKRRPDAHVRRVPAARGPEVEPRAGRRDLLRPPLRPRLRRRSTPGPCRRARSSERLGSRPRSRTPPSPTTCRPCTSSTTPRSPVILSFTHTYAGQALAGEVVEAAGVIEEHGDERWLVVGTSREPVGEYIRSRTLIESA